ncbi:MAG: hypothetical protein M3O70_27110 [Actinomycetota bacterium]|nr:hypothetical protein [Actinomycetota bacterium]
MDEYSPDLAADRSAPKGPPGDRHADDTFTSAQVSAEMAALRETRRLLCGLLLRLEYLDGHGLAGALQAIGHAANSTERSNAGELSPNTGDAQSPLRKNADQKRELLRVLEELICGERAHLEPPSRLRDILIGLLNGVDAAGSVLHSWATGTVKIDAPSSAHSTPEWAEPPKDDEAPSEPIGQLADGTAFYAPIGKRIYDPKRDRVQCHLCGRWFKVVAGRHLARHPGWTRNRYYETFGLVGQVGLVRPATSRRLRQVASQRLESDDRIRRGLKLGWQMARSGELSRRASRANRGRVQRPEQILNQRGKSNRTGAPRRLAAARRRAATLEADTARMVGFESFAEYFADRRSRGWSFGEIARETGRSRRWVAKAANRYEGTQPATVRRAESHARQRLRRLDAGARAVGFPDAGVYLRQRHLVEGRSVNTIVRELRSYHGAVLAALQYYDIPYRRGRGGRRPAGEAPERPVGC